VNKSEHIKNELIAMDAQALLSNIQHTPFAVPEGYFDQLQQEIAIQTVAMDSAAEPILSIGKDMPFQAPAPHYFDQLSEHILAKIEDQGPNWSKVMPYRVPEQYFETLLDNIVQKAKTQLNITKKPVRISLFRNVQLAASVALIIFVGFGVLQFNKEVAIKHMSLEHISQDEIQQYVNENIDEFDTDIILNSMPQQAPAINHQQLSKEDIQAYLNENGQ
jgi:hypothetical protein